MYLSLCETSLSVGFFWSLFPSLLLFFLENTCLGEHEKKNPATSNKIDNKTNPSAPVIKGDIKTFKMDGDFSLTICYHNTTSRRTNGEQLLCRSKRENMCTFRRISQCCCAVELANRSMIQKVTGRPNRPQSKSKKKSTPEEKSCHIAVW